MDRVTTSWIILGIGVVVALLGWLVVGGTLGTGILGFGLAWIVLGILDMLRPNLKTE